MQRSESINELALALSKFQAEVKDAERDTQAYTGKYAKLDKLFDIIRPLLSKHGLSVSQPISSDELGKLVVETILMHASGQYISSTLLLPTSFEAKNANALQKIGMASSYAKRYALMGVLGFCQKDEDNDAEGTDVLDDAPIQTISSQQVQELQKLIKDAHEDADKILQWVKKSNPKATTLLDMPLHLFAQAKSKLNAKIKANYATV